MSHNSVHSPLLSGSFIANISLTRHEAIASFVSVHFQSSCSDDSSFGDCTPASAESTLTGGLRRLFLVGECIPAAVDVSSSKLELRIKLIYWFFSLVNSDWWITRIHVSCVNNLTHIRRTLQLSY